MSDVCSLPCRRRGDQDGLYLFTYDGDFCGPWRKQVLKDTWGKANQVVVADLDGDGRLDIPAEAERGQNELRWWENPRVVGMPWRSDSRFLNTP